MVLVVPRPIEMPEIPITVLPVEGSLRDKSILDRPDQLGFGKYFTDRMFVMEYVGGKWVKPTIKKNEPLSLDPAASVLHYAQEIFEGMKAFRQDNGRIVLFRPDRNITRLNQSADRMCMPRIDPKMFIQSLRHLVKLEKDWVPKDQQSSLYIRPTFIATDAQLGVRPSDKYLFYIILSPSGPYFKEGFKPVKIFVTDKYVRAVPGGVGFAKTGGNYARSLKAMEDAAKFGCSQVLWLDGIHRRYIEEVGAMNIFFVKEGIAYTAPLNNGTILPGVTRESIIQICRDLGIEVRKEFLDIDETLSGIQEGEVTEVFGTGTAAVVSPIGELIYKNEQYVIGQGAIGPITERLYRALTDIQRGRGPDLHNWIVPVD